MALDLVRRFPLQSFSSERGKLTVIEALPFDIRRAFFLYRVPEGISRGEHSNRDEHVFVAVSGSFELLLDDGAVQASWKLDRPDEGVYVPPMIWRELRNFSVGAICLVLSSSEYSADNYIRHYDQFVDEAREPGTRPRPVPPGRESSQ